MFTFLMEEDDRVGDPKFPFSQYVNPLDAASHIYRTIGLPALNLINSLT